VVADQTSSHWGTTLSGQSVFKDQEKIYKHALQVQYQILRADIHFLANKF